MDYLRQWATGSVFEVLAFPEGVGFSSTDIGVIQLICRWWETFNSGLLVLLLGFANSEGVWILIRRG